MRDAPLRADRNTGSIESCVAQRVKRFPFPFFSRLPVCTLYTVIAARLVMLVILVLDAPPPPHRVVLVLATEVGGIVSCHRNRHLADSIFISPFTERIANVRAARLLKDLASLDHLRIAPQAFTCDPMRAA